MSCLIKEYIQPLANSPFPVEGAGCDDHHSFLAVYEKDQQSGLDMHEDDCDVLTIVLCRLSCPSAFTNPTTVLVEPCSFVGKVTSDNLAGKYTQRRVMLSCSWEDIGVNLELI